MSTIRRYTRHPSLEQPKPQPIAATTAQPPKGDTIQIRHQSVFRPEPHQLAHDHVESHNTHSPRPVQPKAQSRAALYTQRLQAQINQQRQRESIQSDDTIQDPITKTAHLQHQLDYHRHRGVM